MLFAKSALVPAPVYSRVVVHSVEPLSVACTLTRVLGSYFPPKPTNLPSLRVGELDSNLSGKAKALT